MDDLNCLKCDYKHKVNGNCTAVGGFCTAVPAAYCRKLKEYMDTGLTPEEVGELISPETVETVRLLSTMADEGSMQHMLELFQAEAQGRLIVLPIPFGAKKEAYAIANDDLDDEVPKEIVTLDCEEIENLSIWPSGELVVTVDGWEIGNSDIGKTVFLTRAEAEAALKGGNV